MKIGRDGIIVIISAAVVAASAMLALSQKNNGVGEYTITPKTTAEETLRSDFVYTATSAKTRSARTTKSKTSKTSKTTTTTKPYDFPADINYATEDMLCAVPGIGEITAQNIISYRDSVGGFTSIYELLNIDGIGEAKLSRIQEYFYVENDPGIEDDLPSDEPVYITEKPVGTTTSQKPERQIANINTDSAEALAQKLLIDGELAEQIVWLRSQIGEYVNIRELLMCKGFTESLLVELDEYIEL